MMNITDLFENIIIVFTTSIIKPTLVDYIGSLF